MTDCFPKAILILSGKRKSGKDYVADLLNNKIGQEHCVIIRLSGPLKKQYAEEHNLNYEELLKATDYKEMHRLKMIDWGEEKRNQDPGFFCRSAISQANTESKPVWIISDARRITDLEFFLEKYPSVSYTMRVYASEDVRKQRGWRFTEGVDDKESECGLDGYQKWNFMINNADDDRLHENLKPVLNLIKDKF